MHRRAYKFHLYPNRGQAQKLVDWLGLCCQLYNACLQQRREAWKRQRKSLSMFDQQYQLPEMKAENLEFKIVNSQVLQNVCNRADLAFKAFFRRCKAGQNPGYPRFKPIQRYRSFTHPRACHTKWTEQRLYIPNLGWIRWRPPATLEGVTRVKTITVKREADGWYAILSCEIETPEPLPATGRTIGIDLGLENLVMTSDGEVLGDLAPLKRAERKLRRQQRIVSRRKRGSNRRKKAVAILARRYQDLARARLDQLHKISRKLVNGNDVICIEDLDIEQLINLGGRNAQGRGLRRNFRHAALGTLTWMLTYKAESAGRRLVKVDPRGTSQVCSGCGERVPKQLKDREHHCPHCGLRLHRDHNSALEIEKRGLREPFVEQHEYAVVKREATSCDA